MALTTDQIRACLKRITYKPGYRFTVYDGQWEGQHLVITTAVPDAYHPDRTVTLDIHSPLPPMPDDAALHAWLMWRLWRIETHELREWFRVDGVPVSDPHAPGAARDNPTYTVPL